MSPNPPDYNELIALISGIVLFGWLVQYTITRTLFTEEDIAKMNENKENQNQ